ncbi:MAG: prepilin peptidase [Candidatus Thorarchaeota archaeon]
MDLILGICISAFFFLLLSFAALRDYQTREVSNWVWLVGLIGLPITIYRIVLAGLLLVFGLQAFLALSLVILGFRVGVLGGADGKTVLIISLLCPWIILNPFWLLFAPFLILIGGFLLVGVHSLWLLLQNTVTWNRISKTQGVMEKPEKRAYWLTRQFSVIQLKGHEWKQVSVPLIVYFCIIYTTLLFLTCVLL